MSLGGKRSMSRTELPIDYRIGELFSSDDRECKAICIREFDNAIIKNFVKENHENKKSLTYFGLSGANLTDLAHWKDYIKNGVSVENCTNVYHQQIRSLFSTKLCDDFNFAKDVVIVQADIDEILNTSNSNFISNNAVIKDFLPFTLVNLDYYGTVISTTDTGIMRRIELLKNLFRIQWEHDEKLKYLCLLTIYHAGKEIDPETQGSQLISKIQSQAGDKYKDIAEKIIKTKKRIPILSLAVPLFIAEAASNCHTALKVHEKICYKNTSYSMLHFILELEGMKQQHPDPKKRNIFKETNLKKIETTDGRTTIKDYFEL